MVLGSNMPSTTPRGTRPATSSAPPSTPARGSSPTARGAAWRPARRGGAPRRGPDGELAIDVVGRAGADRQQPGGPDAARGGDRGREALRAQLPEGGEGLPLPARAPT